MSPSSGSATLRLALIACCLIACGLIACAPDALTFPVDALPGDLVVFVSMDASGQVDKVVPIRDGLGRVEVDETYGKLLVVVAAADLVGPTSAPLSVTEVGALDVRKSTDAPLIGSCPFCAVPATQPPQLLLEGDACPIPPFAAVFDPTHRLDSSDPSALALERSVVVTRPGTCSAWPEVAATSPPLDIEFIHPPLDAEPVEIAAMTPSGASAFVSERVALWIGSAGERTTHPVTFPGPIIDAEALGDASVLVLSLDTDQADLARVFSMSSRGVELKHSIPRFSGIEKYTLCRAPSGSVLIIHQDINSPHRLIVYECDNLSTCTVRGSLSRAPDKAESVVALDESTLLLGGQGAVFALDLSPQLATRDVSRLGSRVHLGRVGSKGLVYTVEEGRYRLHRSQVRGTSPWETILTSSVAISGIVHRTETETWVSMADGRALVLDADDHARAGLLAELGLPADLFRPDSIPVGTLLARARDGEWLRSHSGSPPEPTYGREHTLPAAAIVPDGDAAWVFWPSPPEVTKLEGRALGSPISLPVDPRAFVVGAARSRADGTFWIAATTPEGGFAGRLDVSINPPHWTKYDLPEITYDDVAEVAHGVGLLVGAGWKVYELRGDVAAEVEVAWDDPSTPELETSPGTNDCARTAEFPDPFAPIPGSWRHVASAGGGVAWLGGCSGVLARYAAGRVQRVALPAEVVADSTLGQSRPIESIQDLEQGGVLFAVRSSILDRVNLVEARPRRLADRADGLRIRALPGYDVPARDSPRLLMTGTPSVLIDPLGHLTVFAQTLSLGRRTFIERPFALDRWTRLDAEFAGAVALIGDQELAFGMSGRRVAVARARP
ncbi:MAG: hypothetical protein HY791_19635 [Deltaproteobacteria bacterium]|nr:hypothetical protein [Deltaproteobacteria bacterium]